jgi:hypothetical protein
MTPSPRTTRPRRFQRFLAATLTALALSPLLSGCAGPQVQDYAQEQPALDLKQYFNGPMQAHGIFTDRSGKVVKRFVVDMPASWKGNEGTLDERFTYSDGTKQTRIWYLTDRRQWPLHRPRRRRGGHRRRPDRRQRASELAPTPWPCRSTAASGMCSSTTGCTS